MKDVGVEIVWKGVRNERNVINERFRWCSKGIICYVMCGLFPLGFSPIQVLMFYANKEWQMKGSIGQILVLLPYYACYCQLSLLFGFICEGYSWKNDYFILDISEDMKNYLNRVKIGLVSQETHGAIFWGTVQ